MIVHQPKILKIIDHREDIRTFYIDKPKSMTWIEGAHTHLALDTFSFEDPQRKNWVRHMSIMTCDDEDFIGITTKNYNNASLYKNELWKLNVGDKIKIFNTHSNFALNRENKDIVLISMGVGLASCYPLIKAYKKNQKGVKSLTNLTIANHQLLYPDIDEDTYDSYRNIHVNNRQSFYQAIDSFNSNNTLFYVVGSDPFLKDVLKHLSTIDVSKKQVILDKNDLLSYYFLSVLR